MNAFRKMAAIGVLVAVAFVPAQAASAHSGDGLSASGIVEWLVAAEPQQIEEWSSLYAATADQLRATSPRAASEVEGAIRKAEVARMTTPCSDAFLSNQVETELAQIRLRLEGMTLRIVGPAVCAISFVPDYVAPGIGASDGRPDTMLIYGYNFGRASLPRVQVVHATGIKSLQNEVSLVSHSLLSVNLSSGDPPYCGLAKPVLTVSWDGQELFHTPLVSTPCFATASAPAAEAAVAPDPAVDDSIICAMDSGLARHICVQEFDVP